LVSLVSSAGLTDERVSLLSARRLKKTGPGGGDASEEITVHEVPLDQINNWLAARSAEGKLVDARVYAGIYFAQGGD
jgi:ADP-ribose pyrophosphatase